MGLFSKNDYITEGYLNSGIMNESIDTPSIYDGRYDHTTMESAFRIVAETEQNYTNIMKAVGVEELAAFEEGREFVLEAGFLDKIVSVLKGLWEKVKGLFRKFIAAIDSATKSDKDFINKYKSYLMKPGVLKDFKYKGYKFTISPNPTGAILDDSKAVEASPLAKLIGTAIATGSTAAIESILNDDTKISTIKSTITDFNEKWDDTISDNLRSEIVTTFISKTSNAQSTSSSKSMDAEEAGTALFEAYRNGDSDKTELEGNDIDLSAISLELGNSAEVKKTANRIFKDAQKAFDDAIKKAEKLSNETLKKIPGKDADKDKAALETRKQEVINQALNIISRVLTFNKNVNTVCINAYLKALDDRSKQNKAICVALVNRGTNVKTESVDYTSANESYLGNVKLI
jgi:hypothetical protein